MIEDQSFPSTDKFFFQYMIRTMLKFWLEVFIPLKTRYAELIYNSYRTERFITRLLLLPYTGILSHFGCNLQKRWNFFFYKKCLQNIFSDQYGYPSTLCNYYHFNYYMLWCKINVFMYTVFVLKYLGCLERFIL